VRADVGRCSYRWASGVLGWTCVLCGAFGVNILCTSTWVSTEFAFVFFPRAQFVDAIWMTFKELFARLACIRMGFKGYDLKTRTNSMQVMPPMLQTCVNIWISCYSACECSRVCSCEKSGEDSCEDPCDYACRCVWNGL
jgi:hypothetical protein